MRELNRPPTSFVLTPRPRKGQIPTNWSRYRKSIKKFVEWALANQSNQCAFCGFTIGDIADRRAFAVDHFAPQADSLYPQWRFEALNLIITCHSCNSVFKGEYDSVITLSTDYTKCYFSLVHPYLDVVNDHLTGTYSGGTEQIGAPVFHTLKGLRTIRQFKLDDPSYIATINKQAIAFSIDAWKASSPSNQAQLYQKVLAEIGGTR